MAIRMVFIRRSGGDNQATPDHKRAEQVGHGFNRVGYQRVGMTEDAGDQLGPCQQGVDGQSSKGGAQAALKPALRHCETLQPASAKMKPEKAFGTVCPQN